MTSSIHGEYTHEHAPQATYNRPVTSQPFLTDILQKKDHVPEQLVYLDLAFSLCSTQAQPGASAGLSAISTVRTLPLLVRSGHTTGATMNGGSFPAQSIREGYHLGGVAPEALRGGARVDQGYAVTLCLILLA